MVRASRSDEIKIFPEQRCSGFFLYIILNRILKLYMKKVFIIALLFFGDIGVLRFS